MALFKCTVIESTGKTSTIEIEAKDEEDALRMVSSDTVIPVAIHPIPDTTVMLHQSGRTRNAVLEFTEMMHHLTEAGLSVRDALEIASTIGTRSPAGEIARTLAAAIKKGIGFSQAIGARPDLFHTMYRGLISVGDQTGSIEKIFPHLASYLREQKKIRDKIMSALAYPMLVLFVTLAGTIGLVFFVIPKMETIFAGFGSNAALQVQHNIVILKTVSIGCLLVICALFVAEIILSLVARKQRSVQLIIDRMKISIPFFGRFVVSQETLKFAFAMETLASGGIAIEDALEQAEQVVSNAAYRDAIHAVREAILKGHSLSEECMRHKEFPVYVSQWMLVGERSGKTERVFTQIRQYFQTEIDKTTQRFTTLLEPALIVIIGVFLLILVVTFVLPLFSLYASVL